MFESFRRNQLVKKGMACGKTRRRRTQSEWLNSLECGSYVKFAIFLGFVIGLGFLIFHSVETEPTKRFIIGLLIFLTALAQLWINHPNAFASNSRLFLMFGTFLTHLGLAKMFMVLGETDPIRHVAIAKLIIPYAFAPLVLSVLLGKNHGLYAATFVSLWSSIMIGSDKWEILSMSLITGFIAVYVTLQVRRRSRLIRAGIYVGLAELVLAMTFGWIGPIDWFELGKNDWSMVAWQSLAAIGTGLVTATVVGGVLPMLEMIFGITTDISWLEAADLNNPLLKRMTIEAPGTYHHSLVVANLAEAAAEAIGANPTMCRVGAYFHDIGKLVKPEYFTENMNVARNPHDDLAPTMSALIIIAHVKEGIDLALKHKLNQRIVDVIQQHHGTSLVYYFYKRALEQQEDARHGGKIMNIREDDIPEVREESFRYGGPIPQFKECGIIMLADSVESASRSLEKPTHQKIEQLVNEIIDRRVMDHQLDDSGLSLADLRIIAERFRFTLANMLHSRIAYPKQGTTESTAGRQTSTRIPQSAPPISAA